PVERDLGARAQQDRLLGRDGGGQRRARARRQAVRADEVRLAVAPRHKGDGDGEPADQNGTASPSAIVPPTGAGVKADGAPLMAKVGRCSTTAPSTSSVSAR